MESTRTSRREFVQRSLGATGALALGGLGGLGGLGAVGAARPGVGPAGLDTAPRREPPPAGRARQPLRILILGGTGFIGPHQVRYAQAHGHTLTLFNRGRTNPGLFPDVEQLRGDRSDDLKALEGREWDAVLDNSASIPRWVRQSAQLLAGSAGRYLYVSSISAYADFSQPGMDETAPVATIEDPTVEEITGATYGALKALCEEEARAAFGERTIVVRPGLIVGPGDQSDRFTYWPVRLARGGEVLAPGTPGDPVQVIDARDLTGWMIRMLETGDSGTYNATGNPTALGVFLEEIREGVDSQATFTWVPADFLAGQGVRPWADMPAWIPPSQGMEGFGRVSIERALLQGLEFRPLAETAGDTLAWFQAQPEERRASLRAGIAPEREAEVLETWKASR